MIDYLEIKNRLELLAKEDYKKFSLALVPNSGTMLGVSIPDLKKIAKDIAKSDYRAYFNQAKDHTFEEIMLQGLVISSLKTDLEEVFALLSNYIPKTANWSHCDYVVQHLKIIKKHPAEFIGFIKPLLNSKGEFSVRFALVILLSYFLNEEYIDFCFDTFNNIKHEGYYVKMAVAWAVQKALSKFPSKTLEFLNNNNLDDKTFNLAIRKINESQSKSISRELKATVRKMRR